MDICQIIVCRVYLIFICTMRNLDFIVMLCFLFVYQSKAMKYGVPLAGLGALAGGGYMMHQGFHHGSSSSSGSSEEEWTVDLHSGGLWCLWLNFWPVLLYKTFCSVIHNPYFDICCQVNFKPHKSGSHWSSSFDGIGEWFQSGSH